MRVQPLSISHNSGIDQSPDLLRLHLNESPYGPPPEVRRLVEEELERVSRYPDSDCGVIRDRLSTYHGVPADMVLVGNGIDELTLMAALAFAPVGATAVLTAQTFPGYGAAIAATGADVISVPLQGHRVPVGQFAAALRSGPDVAFLCNPHNPTGTMVSREGLEELTEAAAAGDTVLIVDEAYVEFAEPGASAIPAVRAGDSSLVTLRTFSKAYGLAGLRLGYAIGAPSLVDRMRAVHHALPFSVNRLAQVAAVRALEDDVFIAGVRRRTAEVRSWFCAELRRLGLESIESEANFLLVRTPANRGLVARRLLEEHRILVRDLTSFGLSGCIRVSIGTQGEMERCSSAIAAILEEDETMLADVGSGLVNTTAARS